MSRGWRGVGVVVAAISLAGCCLGLALDGTPEQALVDILKATKPEEVERHLPQELVEAIKTLDAAGRAQCEEKILIGKSWLGDGSQALEPEDGQSLMVIETERGQTAIRVEREAIGGGDAVLELGVEYNHESGGKAIVWLHMEDGEWRVTEVQPLSYMRVVALDRSFVEQFRDAEQKHQESTVAYTLHSVAWAVGAYAAAHPDQGFPFDLVLLAPAAPISGEDEEDTDQASPQYLEEAMAKNEFTKDGYAFHYELRVSGGEGAYALTARPQSYRSGRRSFYMDQTGVMRATGEDREATAEDAPVE